MLDISTVNSPAFCCGKTSPESCKPKTMPLGAWLGGWLEHLSHCNRQGENGQVLVMCIRRCEISRGASSMLNTSECHNHAVESSLWQVLEPVTQPKYSLSPRAAEGILRRAKARGKILPDLLRLALHNIANPISAEQLEHQEGL